MGELLSDIDTRAVLSKEQEETLKNTNLDATDLSECTAQSQQEGREKCIKLGTKPCKLVVGPRFTVDDEAVLHASCRGCPNPGVVVDSVKSLIESADSADSRSVSN